MGIEPAGRIPAVRAELLKLSARLIISPNGEGGVDVNLPVEIPELIFFSVPSAMYHGVADHGKVGWRLDGLADGQDQRMDGVLLVVPSSLADVNYASGRAALRPPAFKKIIGCGSAEPSSKVVRVAVGMRRNQARNIW